MFKLSFRTDNAAFDDDDDDDAAPEIARILRLVADSVSNGVKSGSIRDISGNTIGKWESE